MEDLVMYGYDITWYNIGAIGYVKTPLNMEDMSKLSWRLRVWVGILTGFPSSSREKSEWFPIKIVPPKPIHWVDTPIDVSHIKIMKYGGFPIDLPI